mmetsp:Transcript_41854/g.91317  ORF Transcript_41854/g.91317 Transcript_41854/m.91317 type:complete len:117 (-) Transcript_41854:285-635(-)
MNSSMALLKRQKREYCNFDGCEGEITHRKLYSQTGRQKSTGRSPPKFGPLRNLAVHEVDRCVAPSWRLLSPFGEPSWLEEEQLSPSLSNSWRKSGLFRTSWSCMTAERRKCSRNFP